MQNQASFQVPMYFSGEAKAHGLAPADPEAGANVVTCTGMKLESDRGYVQLDLTITESTNPVNVGRSMRLFVRWPAAGMSEGAIKAREAEMKALKVAFASPEQQNSVRANVNAMAGGNVNYTFDFAGKTGRLWYEPKNAEASNDKSHPSYKQGLDYHRWIDATTYAEIAAGTRTVQLRNTPLKGGNAATSTATPAPGGFAPAPIGTAPSSGMIPGTAPAAPVAPAAPAPAAPAAPADGAAAML